MSRYRVEYGLPAVVPTVLPGTPSGFVKYRRWAGPALVLAALLSPLPSPAQDGKAPASGGEGDRVTEGEAAQVREPVTLDGQTLFRVRGYTVYPAARRAREIGERIGAAARDRAIDPQALRVVEADGRSAVMAADRHLLFIYDSDARAEDADRKALASLYRDRIAEAVKAYREERVPRVLFVRTLYALGATALFLAALWGIRKVTRRIDAWIEQRYKAKIERLQSGAIGLFRPEQAWRSLVWVMRALRAIFMLAVAGVYLYAVLGLFPWTRPLANRLLEIVWNPFVAIGEGLLAAVPNLVFLAVLAFVVRFLLRLARLFAGAVAEGTVPVKGFEREWAVPTYRIVRVFLVAFAFVVAYPYIPGSHSEAFKGVSIFLGVIFSIGSSSVISNVIAGFSMTYRRMFHVGDRIQVGDMTGDVTEIRNQVTHLRTVKNEEIVIPNTVILNSHVVNYSSLARQRGLILHTKVGIGYGVPWRQVEAMLLLAAGRSPGLLRDPPPFVLQTSLGDFCITYELNVYCDDPAGMARLYTDLHRNILDVFNEYGVQIMVPAYEGDPDQPKVVPPERWHAKPAPPESGEQG